jgi:hypothetical protein
MFGFAFARFSFFFLVTASLFVFPLHTSEMQKRSCLRVFPRRGNSFRETILCFLFLRAASRGHYVLQGESDDGDSAVPRDRGGGGQ